MVSPLGVPPASSCGRLAKKEDGQPGTAVVVSCAAAARRRSRARDLTGLAPGTTIAAALLTLEPVAYQVKGEFAGLRTSPGRRLGVIDVREAYSASPPLPRQRLRGGREGPGEVPLAGAEGEGKD
jgi:hypothetical protein